MKLEIEGVHFSYGSRPALEDVTMEVMEGEMVSIVGPNASGKTTLLKCINKILRPEKGAILLGEKDVSKFKLKELAKLTGYVPQSLVHSFPSTVFDTVLLGRRPYISWTVSTKDEDVVLNLLASIGLEDMILRDFNELSGGEKQKVLLARALAQEPEVLLLDEPTNNLDLKYQLEVLDLVRKQVVENGISCLVAIHDLNLAARYSDKIVMLNKGEVYAAGGVDILTSENIEAVYGIEVTIKKHSERIIVIPEDVKNKVK